MRNAMRVHPLAIHINANIVLPTCAPILRSEKLVAADVKMMEIAVPITLATMVHMHAKSVSRLEKKIAAPWRQKGTRMRVMKTRSTAVRKKPNMNCDAIFRILRYVTSCVGRAMVAPARSSLVIIETGSNQYSVVGFEQYVIPWSMFPSQ